MSVRRRKVRDGVLVLEAVSIGFNDPDPAAERAALDELCASVRLAKHRAKAQSIIDHGATERRRQYAKIAEERFGDALYLLNTITDAAAREFADGLVNNVLWAMQSLWRAEVKRIEPELVTGIKRRRGGDKGRKANVERAKKGHARWQAEAEKIWASNRRLSKKRVAELIDPAQADTIRKVITKPK